MDRTDLLDGFPVPPPERQLPDHARRREDLLAAVRATERGDRRPARYRLLVPLAAASAVLAIVIPLSLAGSHLLRSSPQPGPAAGGAGPARAHSGGSWLIQTSHGVVTTLTAGAVSSLTVSADTGDIAITGTSASTVSVTERFSYQGTRPHVTNHQSGGHLTLGYTCGHSDCGVSYAIKVPRGIAITARTGTGIIKLSDLSGQLHASTDIGSVHGTDLSMASADLSTQTGAIRASFDAAPRSVRADAGTGSVDIRVPASDAYAVTVTADTGMVQVTVPRSTSSAHAISAHAGTGLVKITGS